MVAFAFYGDPKLVLHNTTYFEGIMANVAAISSFYKSDWSVRLYHDIADDDPWMVELCKTACTFDNLDLCPVHHLPLPLLSNAVNIFPMLWTLPLRCLRMISLPKFNSNNHQLFNRVFIKFIWKNMSSLQKSSLFSILKLGLFCSGSLNWTSS